jgi:cytochrome c oxidase assembly protein subunit 15
LESTPKKIVGIWLMSGCLLIFCMVVVGGITRLTGSGLSITEWKPIMGAVPPMNQSEWQAAFEKYKQIPQFQKINFDFTLENFKSIFWWEYIHRLLGRFIGVVFIVPFAWFYFRKMLDKTTIKKALFLFLLGGLQGIIGWLMVKSGLTERTSVSHIRLAIHLITAFITYGFTFYFALEILNNKMKKQINLKMLRFSWWLFIIVTVQIIYGAFVAGLHAGKIYNSFPLMNGSVVPADAMQYNPAWENFFDNPAMVQFIHRFFALIIFILMILFFFYPARKEMDVFQKNAVNLFAGVVMLQIILGILTLLTVVNIPLAVIHQAGAFLLFSVCVYLLFISRRSVNQIL